MADREVRDALTRRLRKNLADPTSPGVSPFRLSKLSRPPLSKVCPYPIPIPGDVRVEGYLYKYSSGPFGRWQKRFFILDAGKLCYYKRMLPFDSSHNVSSRNEASLPKKVFSVRRIRSVVERKGCEFELIFSNNKSYQMRASNSADMNKWLSCFAAAMAFCEANPGPFDDDGMSDLGDGSAGSTNSQSNFSEASPRRDSGGITIPVPTVWEKIEIDSHTLSKHFEEWFYFVPVVLDNNNGAVVSREIRVTHVIDACNRVNTHLWSVLGSVPRGADLKLDEALARAKARPASFLDSTTLVVNEYISHLSTILSKCLSIRSAYISSTNFFDPPVTHRVNYSAEIPALMECIVRMVHLLNKLFAANRTICFCPYCDPSGISRKRSDSCSETIVWRKHFRTILQKLGAELEVGLIEELQLVIAQCDSAWEVTPCKQSHPLLESTCALSTFGPSFLQSAQSKLLNASSQWMAAYPLTARLVAEHVASALVACMNSVAREFKRHSVATSALPARNASLNSSTCSVNNSSLAEDETSLDNLVAFANECVLMSKFCEKSFAKFTPPIFIQCMSNLAEIFQTTAADVCHSIVKLHFYPLMRHDMLRAWSVKYLAKDRTSPMDQCQLLFNDSVQTISLIALPCVTNACAELLSAIVLRTYAQGLIKHKPRIKVYKTLPDLFSRDLESYKNHFTYISSDIQILEELNKLLNEQNRVNFSVYFNSFVHHLGSAQQAYIVLTAVTKMREHEFASSRERKDVAKMLQSMKGTLTDTIAPREDSIPAKPTQNMLVVGTCRINWTFEE